MQQHTDTQKIAGERQKRRHEMLKENAKIIFNIINGIEDSTEKNALEGNHMLTIKNEYTWCNKNNQSMLEKLDRELYDSNYDSDMNEQEREEFEYRYQAHKKQQEDAEKVTPSQIEQAKELFSKDVVGASDLQETQEGRESDDDNTFDANLKSSAIKTRPEPLSVLRKQQLEGKHDENQPSLFGSKFMKNPRSNLQTQYDS